MSIQLFDKPKLRDDELLVKVEMCGICGSDQHIFQGDWGEPYPLIPGHEFVGTVAEAGSKACQKHGIQVGDKVAVEMIIPCNTCYWCRKGLYNLCIKDREQGMQYGCNISCEREGRLYGGWSEYLYVPANAIVHRIPDHVPWERAVLIEPLAVTVRAVNLTPPKIGDTVVVVGSGTIGLLTVVAVRAAGAGKVILVGTRTERLALGKELGADAVVDFRLEDAGSFIMEHTDGIGADLVFETAGTPAAQADSLNYARPGGVVNYIGLTGRKTVSIDTDWQMTFKELTLQTSFLSAHSYQGAIKLIADGQYPVEKLITHRFPLEQVEEAIACSADRATKALKVVLLP
ncbi:MULTISPECIES: zinc-dependent alcohol dehydrogenase [Aneurinibacillus]|uniref:Alcohol dehydrogenase n=1 Tax=Aneurinibacillus danicus TaxID=267746 RepID=A0A511V730_9BACL|nr:MULTISPECIES: alcohol dehydrogenase catalytic domain-containing protein [Aneurinibacillus]GEN34775.1 alcohol dehydrogenase [Aneurinibacillus danicus]